MTEMKEEMRTVVGDVTHGHHGERLQRDGNRVRVQTAQDQYGNGHVWL